MNKKIKKAAATAALALSLTSVSVHSAVDIFIQADGIKGESVDADFKDAIDVLAWGWGLSSSGSLHIGSGAGAGKASFQDVSFTKFTDRTSPVLYQKLVEGEIINQVKLSVRKGGATPEVTTELTLKDVLVSSATTGGSGGEDRLTENITLHFREFCILNNSFDQKGALIKGTPFCWNIATNTTA